MFERGGFSFIALLLINPVLILLFQNCALVPETQSEALAKNTATQKRQISSLSESPQIHAKLQLENCDSVRQSCPTSEIE